MNLFLPEKWKARTRAVADLLYPLSCPACRAWLPRAGAQPGDFCPPCLEMMVPVKPPFCAICAEPFAGDITMDFTCPNCAGREHAFEFAVSRHLSRGPVREAVHRLKYGGVRPARLGLARLMAPALEEERLRGVPWLLVPVPLHPRKQRRRGYNQSGELTRVLSHLTGLAWCEALRRIRFTESQAGLDRADRLKNLQGAFAVTPRLAKRLEGQPVLLVDDVFTTGATANECALVLRRHGAARVAVLTAARG